MQEMAMERVERAIERDEGGITRILPTRPGATDGEFHFTFPTEVTMVNASNQTLLGKSMTEITFEVQVKFMVYLATEQGEKGAEIIARADILDEGVRLNTVDVRDLRAGRKVRLKGAGDEHGDGPGSRIVHGEGEGKTIDAMSWTSR